MSLMKLPEELRKYFVSIERGCSSDSYVLMIRWGERDNVLKRLRENCVQTEGVDGIFYRFKSSSGRLTLYLRTGKLMVEPEGKDVIVLLSEIFGGK